MAVNRYLDFDLRIWFDEGRYLAQVTQSPDGTSQRETLRAPFGDDSHELLRLRLENAVLRGGSYRGAPISREEKVLREFGSRMYSIVFKEPESVASRFRSSQAIAAAQGDGLRIKLTVEPPELAMLPWEYVFDDSEDDSAQSYLCLRQHSPLVRSLDIGRARSALSVTGPLNVLGMIASPRGEWKALDTAKERSHIEEAIRSIPDQSAVNFKWVTGDTQAHLLDMMQREDWHVFHFIGHGGVHDYESDDGTLKSEGFIVLGDGRGGATTLPASELALTLQGGPLQLAVLNCCDSARGSDAASPGAALVRSGVPAVVAMQYPITDDAAIGFAGMFYNALVAGQPIEKALTAARVLMYGRSKVEWGIPVLFTRANSNVLFKIDRPLVAKAAETQSRAAEQPPPLSDYEVKRRQAQAELRRLFG